MTVLADVKEFLNIPWDFWDYDKQLKPMIEMAFADLVQFGVPNAVEMDQDLEWSALGSNRSPHIKEYVCLRTKMAFDPPQNAFLVIPIEKRLTELQNRIIYHYERFEGGVDKWGRT